MHAETYVGYIPSDLILVPHHPHRRFIWARNWWVDDVALYVQRPHRRRENGRSEQRQRINNGREQHYDYTSSAQSNNEGEGHTDIVVGVLVRL